jgi:hypothetical protein
MAKLRKFRVYHASASQDDDGPALFAVEGPTDLEYVKSCQDLAKFIETTLNAAFLAFAPKRDWGG